MPTLMLSSLSLATPSTPRLIFPQNVENKALILYHNGTSLMEFLGLYIMIREQVYIITEAANLLGINRATIRRWIRAGKLRILAIIDEYTRECLAIRVAPSIPALVVVGVLEWLFLTRGVPKFLRSDNGPEFVVGAESAGGWRRSAARPCSLHLVVPGRTANIESFFDKLRDECLNREVFRNGREAQAIVENWRQEYNNYRPHSSLDYLTPAEFARRYYENKQAGKATQPVEMAGTLSL